MEEDSGADKREELVANIRRLTSIVLERLEQGSRDATLDPGQVRMLGSIALRSLRLWQEALRKNVSGRPAHQGSLEAQAELAQKLALSEERGEED